MAGQVLVVNERRARRREEDRSRRERGPAARASRIEGGMRKMVAPGPRPAPRAVSIQAGFMEEVPVAYRRWPRGRQGVQGPGDPLCGRPLDPGEREPRAGSARRRDGGVVRSLGCKFYSDRFTAYGGGGASVGPEPVGRRSRTRGSDRRGPFLDESPLDLRRCKLFAVSVKTVWVGFRLDRPGEVADPIGLAPHQDRGLQFMEAQHRAGHASGAVPGRGGTDRPGRRRQQTRWGRHPSETETADRLDFNI